MARTRDPQEKTAAPRNDAYVGLLAIALLAQIAGAVFFFLDYQQYPANKPPTVEAPKVGQPQPQQPGGVVPNPGAGGGQAGMGGGQAGMGGGNVGNQGGGVVN